MKPEKFRFLVVENAVDVCEGIERRMLPFEKWESLGYCTGVKEAIQKGQAVKEFVITLYNQSTEVNKIIGTTIGKKRVLSFQSESLTGFTVEIKKSKGTPVVSGIEAYLIPDNLIEK